MNAVASPATSDTATMQAFICKMHSCQYSDEGVSVCDSQSVRSDEMQTPKTASGENPFDIYHSEINDMSQAERGLQPKKDYSNIRGRNWCITWNNYPSNWKDRLQAMPGWLYIIGYPELGDERATPHIQGFVRFKNERTLGALTKTGEYHKQSLMGMDVVKGCFFIREIYGTPFRWIQYCKKQRSPDFLEIGEMKSQGQRQDLTAVTDAIALGGRTLDELRDEFRSEFIKFPRGLETFFASRQQHRTTRPAVHWLYGRSGLGKTGYAFAHFDASDIYIKTDAGAFWNDYQNQMVVLINEFYSAEKEEGGWKLSAFLQLIDQYQHVVNIKGSFGRFNSSIMYITSPHPPEYFYPDDVRLEQVIRRLDSVVYITSTDEAKEREDYKFPYFSADAVKPISWTTKKLDETKAKYQIMKSAQDAMRRQSSRSSQVSSRSSRSVYSDEV